MISILIPIYNGIEFLEECLFTIRNQSYKDWEVIIGINGHCENSEVYKIASSYSNDKIKVYDLYFLKGKPATLNKMIEYCSYDWVSLLDVDDGWMSNKLSYQVRYMKDYDVIGTMCIYFGDINNVVPSIPGGNISNFDFLSMNPIINSSVLIKKELCNWKEDCFVEDYELWLRLWKQGKKFYNVPSVHVMHRIHQQSAFNSKGNHLHVKKLVDEYRLK
jgi:glycosyltransferase involved in cell wall biosynthesis